MILGGGGGEGAGSMNPPKAVDKMSVCACSFWLTGSITFIIFWGIQVSPKQVVKPWLSLEESVWSGNLFQVHWGRGEGKLRLRATSSPSVLREANMNKIRKTSKKQQNHWRKNFSVFGEESLDDQGAPPSLLITYPSSHPAIHPSCHPPIIHSSIQIVTGHLLYPRS